MTRIIAALMLLAVPLSATAQDGLVDRVERLESATERLLRALTWEKAGDNLREVVDRIASDVNSHNDVPEDRAYEYAIQRNGGWRRLHFSTWNGGWRVMTEPYLRGDKIAPSNKGLTFARGGSFWIIDTQDPSDDGCTGTEMRHHYYQYYDGGVEARNSNDCTVEGPVWRRARLFADDAPN